MENKKQKQSELEVYQQRIARLTSLRNYLGVVLVFWWVGFFSLFPLEKMAYVWIFIGLIINAGVMYIYHIVKMFDIVGEIAEQEAKRMSNKENQASGIIVVARHQESQITKH